MTEYDELMKTIQLHRAYPLKGPELETKADEKGKTYKFNVSAVAVVDRATVVVYGQDKHEVWCKKAFKAKTMPKWLKRGLRELQPK
jgi:hypothetical protein